MDFLGLIYALGAIIVWSSNAIAGKFAFLGLAIPQVLALQFLGAAVAVLCLRLLTERRIPTIKANSFHLGLIGLVGTMTFQYVAFRMAPIAEANILAYSWPLFIALYSTTKKDIIQSLGLIIMAIIGLFGISLIVVNDAVSFSFSNNYIIGYLAAIMSALCMAIYSVKVARIDQVTFDFFFHSTLIAGIIFLSWCWGQSLQWPKWPYVFAGIYIGIGPIATGYFLWSLAMSKFKSPTLGVLGYLTAPLSTAWLFLSGEQLSSNALIGSIIVVLTNLGVLYLLFGPKKQRSY